MDGIVRAMGEAIGLGIWTATLPCPMATNLAAIAFLSRRLGRPRQVFWAGLLYALGGTLTYLALAALVTAGAHASRLSTLLQANIQQILGPLLILAGMLLLELIRLPRVGLGADERLRSQVERWGVWSALPLGMLLALAFCPVSAACFFLSVLRLMTRYDSWLVLPALYGIGTALPVVAFALLLALGAQVMAKAFNVVSKVQWWAQRIAGAVLILLGIYLSLRFIFEVC
jgi:cytochrome c biogenesis protein CcdA